MAQKAASILYHTSACRADGQSHHLMNRTATVRDRGESRKGSIDLGAWQGDGVHDLTWPCLTLPYLTFWTLLLIISFDAL